jgi:hypothetical protein
VLSPPLLLSSSSRLAVKRPASVVAEEFCEKKIDPIYQPLTAFVCRHIFQVPPSIAEPPFPLTINSAQDELSRQALQTVSSGAGSLTDKRKQVSSLPSLSHCLQICVPLGFCQPSDFLFVSETIVSDDRSCRVSSLLIPIFFRTPRCLLCNTLAQDMEVGLLSLIRH